MPARSGQHYVESLKKHAPCVYLGGRRVVDVTAEPIFQEPIRAIAEQYDMQLDPAYRDVMTYPSPSTGEPVSTSFLVRYSREELTKKRKHFKLRADHNFGFMGRAPDFMNQLVTGWHLMADRFARAGARFGDNATRYYEHVRALGHRDGEPIPISPDNPGSPIPYQPDTRGMAGTYAATSLPTLKDER